MLYSQLTSAHQAASELVRDITALRDNYFNQEIKTLTDFKRKLDDRLKRTPWHHLSDVDILKQHRRSGSGEKTFKEWAYECLKRLGMPRTANYLFKTKTSARLDNLTDAIHKMNDPKPKPKP